MNALLNATLNAPNPDGGLASILAKIGASVDTSKSQKAGAVQPCSEAEMRKICPEMTNGLLDAKGNPHPGAIMFKDEKTGGVYIARFVVIGPRQAKFILNQCGEGNRDAITAKQKDYEAKMAANKWHFVGNTVIFTVPEFGDMLPSGFEQHNGGHTCRAIVATGKPQLFVAIFGIPLKFRDLIDDNAARSVKDVASTRKEIKERFAKGVIIGGAVALTDVLSKKCLSTLSESLRIVLDVRAGKQPKSGGSRDKNETGDQLDLYGEPLCEAISLIVVLDSRCGYMDKKAGKMKTAGGLALRYGYNHLASLMMLAATDNVGTEENPVYQFNHEVGYAILEQFSILGSEAITDDNHPMVRLRDAVDAWKVADKHKGSAGQNYRYACLKIALLKALAKEEIRNPTFFDSTDWGAKVTSPALQVGGIDDWKDDSDELMNKANEVGTTDNEPQAFDLELEPEAELTEQTSDVPAEDDLLPE